MPLNIKNDETEALVARLAKATGETKTTAIKEAVRERLERVTKTQKGRLSERLLAIGRDCAARMKQRYRTLDHGDFLYDEKGLPK